MKVKLVDLTLRQIINICDKHNTNCFECPLIRSRFNCGQFNKKYANSGTYYDRNKLMKEKVELDDEN